MLLRSRMSVYAGSFCDNLVNISVGTRELKHANIKGNKIALDRIIPHITKSKLELSGSWFEEIVLAVPRSIYEHARTHDYTQDEEKDNHNFEHLPVGY